MADENAVADPVVEPEVKEPVSPQAEETAPAPDAGQEAEPAAGDEVNPLSPGGDRFKQVWARSKAAEAKAEELKAELQREREERIRYEERLKAQEQTKAQTQEYTWAQLEEFIAEGKISRAQAAEYRENLVAEKARIKAEKALEERLASTSKQVTVQSEIDKYVKLVPELRQAGTAERQKVEREYAYMVEVLNFPHNHATELAATRAALGDIETVERAVTAKRTATKEPFVETHSSSHKPQPKPNDPVAKLDERTKAHYTKMIDRGLYSGWDEVREELNWQKPKNVRVARG